MKIYSKSHERALSLIDNMNKTTKEHMKYLKKQERKPTDSDKVFARKDASFNKKEDELYKKYYDQIHKDFGNIKLKDFKDYKDGFVDKHFANKMYRDKASKRWGEKWELNNHKGI